MARAPALQEIEALPESDRLADTPHPRAMQVLFGHEAAEQELAAAFASGRMHHGWLFAGPEGIGKATLAYRFARHVLADPSERDPFGQSLDVAPETRAARQVLALSHPGLLVIRRPWDTKTKRFTATIPVDDVRRLKAFLSRTAEADAMRVVIVDSADELNVNAANALLKSLEEPPLRTLFLVIVSEPGRLLPTIRSRCRMLTLSPLGEKDLRRAALRALESSDRDPPGPGDWTRLIDLSEGSVRRLVTLWADDGLKLQARIEALLGSLPKLDWGKVHALGDELASPASTERFETFFGLLLRALARMIRTAATGSGDGFAAEQAARLISPVRLATWAELWETIVREKGVAMALNLDRKSLIVETFRRIESAAQNGPGSGAAR
jgi:DNA polymerase-3 subunit delta'